MNKAIIQQDIDEILQYPIRWEKFNGRTIMISGADSFIMSYFIYSILEENMRHDRGIKVIALCRNTRRAYERFEDYLDYQYLQIVEQDILETIKYDGDIDYCIHAASPAGIYSRQEKPLDTFETNFIGCRNLISHCKKKGVYNFMLISSVDVYGDVNTNRRYTESDIGLLDWNCIRNCYSMGKRAAETICSLYYYQCDFPCVIIRPYQVYGPGLSLSDGRLNGDFIGQLMNNGKIILNSNGVARRSFLYLTDMTTAIYELLPNSCTGEIFNICDEHSEKSVRELADMYVKVFGRNAIVEYSMDKRDTLEVKGAPSITLGNSEKLRQRGWKARITLDIGIRRCLNYYINSQK